jgi:hypothetical protein
LVTTGFSVFLENSSSSGDPHNGSPETDLDDVGVQRGEIEPQHGPYNRKKVEAIRATGRASRRLARFRRKRPGPGGEGSGKGDHQSDTANEIDVKGKETTDQRDVKNAAADARHDGQDSEDQTEKEQYTRGQNHQAFSGAPVAAISVADARTGQLRTTIVTRAAHRLEKRTHLFNI